MAKSKNLLRKKAQFEARKKKLLSEEKNNPFERKVNKIKHPVLNKRINKNEFGQPNQSRHRQFEKRKQTLLLEYNRRHKKGKGIVDNRIKDSDGGAEARKAKIWKQNVKIQDQIETLTHKGIDVQDAHDDHIYNSDDDDMDMLSRPEFVEAVHFGGGEEGKSKSSQEFFDEMLDEKRRRQVQREETVKLTEDLDTMWANLRGEINHKKANKGDNSKAKNDYDILVKQLLFDSKPKEEPKIQITVTANKAQEIAEPPKSPDAMVIEIIERITMSGGHDKAKDLLTSLPEITYKAANHLKSAIKEFEPKSMTKDKLYVLEYGLVIDQMQLYVQMKIMKLLNDIKLRSLNDVALSLVLLDILTIVFQSKYSPEVVTMLQNIMTLYLDVDSVVKFFLPFSKIYHQNQNFLRLEEAVSLPEPDIPQMAKKIEIVFSENLGFDDANGAKIYILKYCLELVVRLSENYKDLESFNEIFKNIKDLLLLLPKTSDWLSVLIEKIRGKLVSSEPKKPLSVGKVKPTMLHMFEPKIADSQNSDNGTTRRKLVKKYKREFKGAQRELRKDANFIKRTQINEVVQKDKDRQRKVKNLMSELAGQQHDYKKKRK